MGTTSSRLVSEYRIYVENNLPLDDGAPAAAPLSPTSKALREVEDIEDSDLLTHARAMCHVVSREEAQGAKKFSDAVERYVQRDFEEALPLLEAALAKATVSAEKGFLELMIKDCKGPRSGVVEGKHK